MISGHTHGERVKGAQDPPSPPRPNYENFLLFKDKGSKCLPWVIRIRKVKFNTYWNSMYSRCHFAVNMHGDPNQWINEW